MSRCRPAVLVLLAGLAAVPAASAQVGERDSSLVTTLLSAQRAAVTRAELEASLVEIDKILASSGYSSSIKETKRAEAALIRYRLSEGDIRPGDVIRITIPNDKEVTNPYLVTDARTIIIPGLATISVANLLRSEVEAHLRKEISKYLRDAQVIAEAQIRIAMFGGINKQGFWVVPASAPITDVLMQVGGGPAGDADLEKSRITRGGKEIVSPAAFQVALREARTLDHLNVQAGDEIWIGEKSQGFSFTKALGVVSAVGSVAFLIIQIF